MALTRPKLGFEIRVDDVVQYGRCRSAPSILGIRQAESQRVARNTSLPVPARELRVNAHADVAQRLMRSERVQQKLFLPKGIEHPGHKTVVRVMQRSNGGGYLLTPWLHGGFAHGDKTLFERGFTQALRHNARPRPQDQPTDFVGTVPLKGLPPVLKQGAYVQTQVLSSAPRRQQHLPNASAAGLRVILKDNLNTVAGPGQCGLQLFRQAAHNGGILFHTHLLQRPLQPQDGDKAPVVSYQGVSVHCFQLAVRSYRPIKGFGQGADTAINAVNEGVKHHHSPYL